MKKEKMNWYILIACLALTALAAVLTIVEMIKSFHIVALISLMVEIFAVGIIVYCFLQEKKEMENEEEYTAADSFEEESETYESNESSYVHDYADESTEEYAEEVEEESRQ